MLKKTSNYMYIENTVQKIQIEYINSVIKVQSSTIVANSCVQNHNSLHQGTRMGFARYFYNDQNCQVTDAWSKQNRWSGRVQNGSRSRSTEDRQASRQASKQAGRQAVRRLGCMVFKIKGARKVREQVANVVNQLSPETKLYLHTHPALIVYCIIIVHTVRSVDIELPSNVYSGFTHCPQQ